MSKYQYVNPGPGVYKPWVSVSLGYRKTHKVTPAAIVALIDSGADVCFCSKDIGIWLGIQFKKAKPVIFTTANRTTFGAVKEMVTLYVCGTNYQCPFYFTEDLPRETPIILGQLGFFDHFEVNFDFKNKTIEII